MRYVLLLRGINVGGKNKVVMSELKELLKSEGFSEVDSYINSGNLFFTSSESMEKIVSKVEKLLEKNYDFSIPFALLSKETYLEEIANLPEWWNEEFARKDILFYSQGTNSDEVVEFAKDSELYNEKVYIGKNAVFLGLRWDEGEFLKTTYHKQVLKQPFYKTITIRNGKTFDKIAELLQKEQNVYRRKLI
uniref:Uncharacterized protein gad190 n=1 Tax=Granulicatella adiacens TaxID=46124 RepID=Q7WYD7_9LACT|nr:hypothetical protein [Granulicatella adiacens]